MKLVNTYALSMMIRVILIWGLLQFSGILSAQTVSLEQCIDTALQYNRNIKLSQQDIYLAGEKSRESKDNLLPKLNGSADYRYYTDLPYQIMPAAAFGGAAGTYKEIQFGVPQNLNGNLQLALPIFNPAAINAINIASVAGELSRIQKVKTEEEVILEVSNAFYNAQILLNQIAFLDSNIINTNKLLQTNTLLHEQQLVKGTDVDRLKLQLDQISNQRNTLFSQQLQVLNVLKFLMGKPISDDLKILKNGNSKAIGIPELQITTDILLIDNKLKFNNAELKGLRNSKLPTLGAYGVYGTNGFGTRGSNSFFNFHPIGYVGAQLTLPLFNGSAIHHKIVQKKIEIEKTTIQKEVIMEKSKLEVINAEMQYALANRNIKIISTQIGLADTIYRKTVLQNQQGIATITDILLADNSLREVQQNYIIALINLRKTELEYKRVTGNLISIKN